MKLVRRLLVRLAALVVVLTVAAGLFVYLLLSRSLPKLDGVIEVDRLAADVTIERDAVGTPTIVARNRDDLGFATGFVHGQDRFFQMDLTRRSAAGELAEIFGPVAIGLDRRNRLHRFRARAQAVVARADAAEQRLMQAYVAGVNAGLESLAVKPFEYFLLRVEPRPWQVEDSILVGYAMALDLNDETASREIGRGLAATVLPAGVIDWLYPRGTRWDAPLEGDAFDPAATPAPEEFQLRGSVAPGVTGGHEVTEDPSFGSNNWAVSGNLSRSGKAIVANDMHLGLAVPGVFYRARLVVTGAGARDLCGVTLPGTPMLIAGSNGHVAWAFTNSYGDWSDAVILRPGDTPGTYLTPDGPLPFDSHGERIRVKGSADQELLVRETIWGPVLDGVDYPHGELAVSWTAHKPEAFNLGQLALERVSGVSAALDAANRAGIPPQNFVSGDRDGNIGWTIAGRIPRRGDDDPLLPADWSETGGWHGWLEPAEYPRILNPESGRIWTANARVVEDDALRKIGDGGYDVGARASQIRDKLLERDEFVPHDMLVIQLDDRALFLSRWRDLLLSVLDDEAMRGNAARREYRELAANWIPRAAPESVGYRLVRAFRQEVRDLVFDMLTASVRAEYGDVGLRPSRRFEGALWALVNERPPHLLAAGFGSWQELMLHAVDRRLEFYAENYDGRLPDRTWGERNTASIRHPISAALPLLSAFLDMPRQPLPGDRDMPRAQAPAFGSAERFAVSPGDEANGYLHIPAGQSGHPLSEFYRASHADWVEGRASRFLPGPARHRLTLSATD